MTWTRQKTWERTLNAAQRATVHRIRQEHAPAVGWTAYMMPTTGPAKYLELRHYLQGGGLARWVIEPDGRVSATNEHGQRRELIAA